MSDVADKWGELVAKRGFAQVPNYLLLLNQFLDKEHQLGPAELLVLIQLVGSWWRKDAMPFPSMGALATRCGVSSRQIQRAINRLEKVGLIRRVKRRTSGIIASNAYDLAPLAALLGEVAKVFPNAFPRNVNREAVARLSQSLAPVALADTDFGDLKPPTLTPPPVAVGFVTVPRKKSLKKLS
jgi:DNA-binding transcriptional regulator YhcF (GntR family)